jgi:hypothetical protein
VLFNRGVGKKPDPVTLVALVSRVCLPAGPFTARNQHGSAQQAISLVTGREKLSLLLWRHPDPVIEK